MKHLLIIAIFVISLTSCAQQEQPSLYERLGGTEGITSIVDDAFTEHIKNPVIMARFIPYGDQPERVAEIKEHFVEFLSAGTGGPAEYTGKDMKTTHSGMNISEAEFMALLDDLMIVLDNHQIDVETKKDMLYISWSLKGMIVGQ